MNAPTLNRQLPRGTRPLLAVVAGLALVATGASQGPGGSTAGAASTVRVDVDRDRSDGRSRLVVGVTHTQHSLDPWGDPRSVQRGRRLLDDLGGYHNQHIYGWGARNPNRAPGEYDWRSLDRRLGELRTIRGEPVVTLCCAPDWMTELGAATSTYPNIPPTAEHRDDFADLAARIARRYPHVKHFVVWNELKGFWDRRANNWDYRAYTDLYNRVWEALKAVDPEIRVGGPYLVVEGTGSRHLGATGYASASPLTRRDREALRYWLEHKRGADFLAIDRKTVSRSHDDNEYTRAQQLALTSWFGDVTRRLRAETDLPIWYMEDYFVTEHSGDFQAVGLASMLVEHVRSGADVSLRWGPQGIAGRSFDGNAQSLFSDTRRAGGGEPYPAYAVYRDVQRHFGRGKALYATRSSSDDVQALASGTHVLLVNRSPSAVRVRVRGLRSVTVAGYGVRLVALADGRDGP